MHCQLPIEAYLPCMDDEKTNGNETPKVDGSYTNQLNEHSIDQLSNQDIDLFCSRLLSARQDVDRLFRNRFGLTAFPYLEILLMVRDTRAKVSVEDLSESFDFSPRLVSRHIDLLVSKQLLEVEGDDFRPSATGEEVLIEFVRKSLAYAFKPID